VAVRESFREIAADETGEAAMSGSANVGGAARGNVADLYKHDFWVRENQKHVPAHYRLRKSARIVNAIVGPRAERDLLDVGCGPATLMHLVRPNIHYYGIDIAIHEPAPNLIETDILKKPIAFDERRFDIVSALGLFEYVGDVQEQKFREIAQVLGEGGKFVLTYTNFGHRDKRIFEAFSNVQPLATFRQSLSRYFTIERCFPTSYNWNGGQPGRAVLQAANMPLRANIPLIAPRLAVEYFFICSRRTEIAAVPSASRPGSVT
jgi:SAM-dependent methyltransferase